MTFPTSSQQAQKQQQDQAKKQKYEGIFIPVLIKFFNQIAKDLKKQYQLNGSLISTQQYSNQLQSILNKQYTRLQGKFNTYYLENQFTGNSGQKQSVTNQTNDNYAYKLLVLIPQSAKIILRTTQNDISDIFKILGVKATPKLLYQAFKQRSLWRAPMIALTETQNGAELQKYLQAKAIHGVFGIALNKSWRTRMDGKERPWHGEANGQNSNHHEGLFTVMGEKLLYPRDTSHGATAANICNCRCAAVYYE